MGFGFGGLSLGSGVWVSGFAFRVSGFGFRFSGLRARVRTAGTEDPRGFSGGSFGLQDPAPRQCPATCFRVPGFGDQITCSCAVFCTGIRLKWRTGLQKSGTRQRRFDPVGKLALHTRSQRPMFGFRVVCVCVCVREREREYVFYFLFFITFVCFCVDGWVCERERERGTEREYLPQTTICDGWRPLTVTKYRLQGGK